MMSRDSSKYTVNLETAKHTQGYSKLMEVCIRNTTTDDFDCFALR